MTEYALWIGNAVMYSGSAILVMLLFALVVFALCMTVVAVLKMVIATRGGAHGVQLYNEWYHSDAGEAARDASRAKYQNSSRLVKWIMK